MVLLKTFLPTIFLSTFTSGALVSIDWNNASAITLAARALADDIITNRYPAAHLPGGIVGLFNDANSTDWAKQAVWWESAAVWSSLIEYFGRTGDAKYNSLIAAGLMAQAGPDFDFHPANQSSLLFNDDIASWANTAMSAAERRVPQPDNTKPAWDVLAARAFGKIQGSWGKSGKCDGGIPYTVSPTDEGYNMATAGSTGNYFQLAARLFRYNYVEDGKYQFNNKYRDAATEAYTWMAGRAGMIVPPGYVYESVDLESGCDFDKKSTWQWSIDAGNIALGAAVLSMNGAKGWDSSETGNNTAKIWGERATKLLGTMEYFQADGNVTFHSRRLYEVDCEGENGNNCWQNDYPSYKGAAISAISKAQNDIRSNDTLVGVKEASAKDGFATCTGQPNSIGCGTSWNGTCDNKVGFQQQAAVLQAVLAVLPEPFPARKSTAFQKPLTYEGEVDFAYPGQAGGSSNVAMPPSINGTGNAASGNGTHVDAAAASGSPGSPGGSPAGSGGNSSPPAASTDKAASTTASGPSGPSGHSEAAHSLGNASPKVNAQASLAMILGVAAMVALGL